MSEQALESLPFLLQFVLFLRGFSALLEGIVSRSRAALDMAANEHKPPQSNASQ
jgi:hypothetical protein